MNHSDDNLILDLENFADTDPVINCENDFGNPDDVEVEIGIGKGRFLIDAARRNPGTNFFGIERASKYLRIAQDRCLKRGLKNVRLIRADAREFIEFFLPAKSVQAYHLYFPDPWPKKRHHKRRLVNQEFVSEIERTLVLNGRFWLATDHSDYFHFILEVLSLFPSLREVDVEWTGIPTNYEEKFRGRGLLINRRVVERT